MVKRILAIGFIFFCATVAWFILGATIMGRTRSANDGLRGKVASTWGGPQDRRPAYAEAWEKMTVKEKKIEDGKHGVEEKQVRRSLTLPLERSRLNVDLKLRHRQKGLLWYSMYAVDFQGTYGFRNRAEKERPVRFTSPYPASNAVYGGLEIRLNGKPAEVVAGDTGAWIEVPLAAGAQADNRSEVPFPGDGGWQSLPAPF